MTVVALQALALRTHLQQHTRPQPLKFLRQVSRVLDVPWSMATGGDLAFDGVAGHRTVQMRILNRYLTALHASAAHDPELGRAFLRVAGLVDPPQSLLTPRVAARALGPALRRIRSDEPTRTGTVFSAHVRGPHLRVPDERP